LKKQEIFKILSRYKRILEEKGFNVIYIGLYGSQNYNLDDEQSDFDVKAIILPSLHDIIFRKVTSTTIECETGNIDVKDLLTFYDVIKKGNFSYIESIETQYSIGDKYIKELFSRFKPNLKSMLGAMHEKRKALTHEYPSKTKEFQNFGCDPKQHHHIVRLFDLLEYNTLNFDCRSYLEYTSKRDYMLEIKRGLAGKKVSEIIEQDESLIEKAKLLIPENYKFEPLNIDIEINTYIEKAIKLELIKENPVQFAREVRTFNALIPKSDLKKFAELEKYNGKDVSYIVYESLEIL